MVIEVGCFTSLSAQLATYKIQARTEGKSPNTLRIYTTALLILQRFLEQRGYSTDVTSIGSEKIREFIGYLQAAKAFTSHPYTCPQQKGLAGHTINCYLRAIRAFWGWLMAEELIEANPFDKIKVPKPPKKIITPFNDTQLNGLLATIDTKSATGFRDQAIILTLLDTGMRVTELTNLTREDVDLATRSLKVRGKGNKERIVPIGISVQRALAKYVNKWRPDPVYPRSNNLFLNRNGLPLTVNRVESIVERLAAKAGIQGVRASPHTFRHTFAISYLRNGGDVFTLQRILGHETLDMVRNYVNVAQSDLAETHLRCSPVDNLKAKVKSSAKTSPDRSFSIT